MGSLLGFMARLLTSSFECFGYELLISICWYLQYLLEHDPVLIKSLQYSVPIRRSLLELLGRTDDDFQVKFPFSVAD